MKYIMMTCKGREKLAIKIKEQIPNLIVNYDDFTDNGKFTSTAWFNYQRGWEIAGDDACVQMDDDIILTKDFVKKIEKVILEYPNTIIQFFSMRKKDIDIGTRFEPLSNFTMQQCYYLPKGVAKKIYEFSHIFYKYTEHKFCPSDIAIADWGKANKMKYLIYCPNLVDHMQESSMINKIRSAKRQSKTFQP